MVQKPCGRNGQNAEQLGENLSEGTEEGWNNYQRNTEESELTNK